MSAPDWLAGAEAATRKTMLCRVERYLELMFLRWMPAAARAWGREVKAADDHTALQPSQFCTVLCPSAMPPRSQIDGVDFSAPEYAVTDLALVLGSVENESPADEKGAGVMRAMVYELPPETLRCLLDAIGQALASSPEYMRRLVAEQADANGMTTEQLQSLLRSMTFGPEASDGQ